jgi:hypothetical protein
VCRIGIEFAFCKKGICVKKVRESVVFKGEINRGLRSTEKRKFLIK